MNPCDCRYEDHNKIEQFHLLGYFLKLIMMMLNIFNVTFFVGMAWRIILVGVEDFYYSTDISQLSTEQIAQLGL